MPVYVEHKTVWALSVPRPVVNLHEKTGRIESKCRATYAPMIICVVCWGHANMRDGLCSRPVKPRGQQTGITETLFLYRTRYTLPVCFSYVSGHQTICSFFYYILHIFHDTAVHSSSKMLVDRILDSRRTTVKDRLILKPVYCV